jgi:diguanylate cyclase (GGDEF)-like protein
VGGDEFIVVLTGRTDVAQAQAAASRMLSILAAPFQQESYELVVTPSIGIAMYPEHGSDAQSLLKNADGAMYEAKASGRNQLRVYDSNSSAGRRCCVGSIPSAVRSQPRISSPWRRKRV